MVDSEVYVWLAAEFYDTSGLTGESIPLWRMHPSAEGGNLFGLAGNSYHSTGRGEFFRSLVPAHGSFTPSINSGDLGTGAFNPHMMAPRRAAVAFDQFAARHPSALNRLNQRVASLQTLYPIVAVQGEEAV